MTPEGKVKAMIKKRLDSMGVWYDMPVPGGYGRATLDFICCYEGQFFAIEAKAPGKKATPRQEHTIKDIRAAGGAAWVVDGPIGMDMVEAWMKLIVSRNEPAS